MKNRFWRKTLGTFLIFGFLPFFSTGCEKKTATVGSEIRFRLPSDPPTLDWTLATDNISKEVISPLQVGLISYNSKSEVQAELAEKWEVSKDAKTYIFTLRPNIKWSDGQPIVAQQFVDSWERLLRPTTASEYAYFMFDIVGAEDYQAGKIKDFNSVGVKAVDERTLAIQLRAPSAYWINVPSFWVTYPIRKDVITKFADKWTDPANIVSTGPYILESYERDAKIVLKKNPNYYKPDEQKPMPDRLVYRVVKDDTTAIALFSSGDLDIVRNLPPYQVQGLSKRPEFHATPFLRGYYYGFDTKGGPTKDVRIRQAIGHAIDRNELLTLLGPSIQPSTYWNQPGLVGHDATIGLEFDINKAKALFKEAKGESLGGFELWYDQQDMNKLVAENIQAQLKRNLGIDLKLTSQEWKVYLKSVRADTPDLFRLGWGADYPDANNFMELFTCKSGNNNTHFCNKRYDELITNAGRELDQSKRGVSYREAEKILLEKETAIVPLFSQTNMHMVSKRVSGFAVNSMGDFDYNAMRISPK